MTVTTNDIWAYMRPRGLTTAQVQALYALMEQGASLETIATFAGLEVVGVEPRPEDAPTAQKFVLSKRSLDRLNGVDEDLVRVVKRAIQISKVDFMVIQGLRSVEEQRENVKKGVSGTMDSYHLTGHAVDLAPLVNGVIDWNNTNKDFNKVYDAMMAAAKEVGVTLTWGGHWKKLVDMPHYQIEGKKRK